MKGNSKLRRGAVAFAWKDVMISSPTDVKAHDAVFELASVLECVALWKMARAAVLCSDCRAGVNSEGVSKACPLRSDLAPVFLLGGLACHCLFCACMTRFTRSTEQPKALCQG